MPILMGATMIFQMRLTPTRRPIRAAKPCSSHGLDLHDVLLQTLPPVSRSTRPSTLFTIGQQMVINRMPEPQLPINTAPPPAPAA